MDEGNHCSIHVICDPVTRVFLTDQRGPPLIAETRAPQHMSTWDAFHTPWLFSRIRPATAKYLLRPMVIMDYALYHWMKMGSPAQKNLGIHIDTCG